MIRETIQKVVDGQDLTERETVDTMNEIMSGEATPAQIASFITALPVSYTHLTLPTKRIV